MALQAPKKQHIVNSCINSKKRLDNSFEHYNALLFFFLVGVYHLLWVFAGFDENRSALGNVWICAAFTVFEGHLYVTLE